MAGRSLRFEQLPQRDDPAIFRKLQLAHRQLRITNSEPLSACVSDEKRSEPAERAISGLFWGSCLLILTNQKTIPAVRPSLGVACEAAFAVPVRLAGSRCKRLRIDISALDAIVGVEVIPKTD